MKSSDKNAMVVWYEGGVVYNCDVLLIIVKKHFILSNPLISTDLRNVTTYIIDFPKILLFTSCAC